MPEQSEWAPGDSEITEEMVEAGALALAGFSPSLEFHEEAAVRIYRAMRAAKAAHAIERPNAQQEILCESPGSS